MITYRCACGTLMGSIDADRLELMKTRHEETHKKGARKMTEGHPPYPVISLTGDSRIHVTDGVLEGGDVWAFCMALAQAAARIPKVRQAGGKDIWQEANRPERDRGNEETISLDRTAQEGEGEQ